MTQKELTYEKTARSIWPVAVIIVATLVLCLVAMGLMLGMANQNIARRQLATAKLPPGATERRLPPLPRLQASPPKELQAFLKSEGEALETLAWVDRELGIVKVPIEVAMEMLVEDGPLVMPPAEPATSGVPGDLPAVSGKRSRPPSSGEPDPSAGIGNSGGQGEQ